MTSGLKLSYIACALAVLCSSAQAQSPNPVAPLPPPSALPLVARVADAGLDPEALRVALAVELGLAVERVDSSAHAHVQIDGASLDALHVAFWREDGSQVERTLDVSSMRAQAAEAVALLAANLVRDEASELLATLHAASTAPPLSAAASPAAPAPAQLQQPALEVPRGCDRRPNLRPVVAGADVVPFVGTDGSESARVERTLSFGVFGSLNGSVRGSQFSTLFNLSERGTCGAQLSGIANISGGPSEGAQLAILNWTQGRLDGAQLGLLDIATGDVYGAQLSLANVAGGDVHGAQLALANVSAGAFEGAQLGLANVNASALRGAQLGLFNLANTRLRGLQMGLANVASGPVEGAQLGLANVSSGQVHGAQIGLVNVAENADAAVGLVNVMWRGQTHLDVWGTDAGLGMVGLEHGSRGTYNLYGVGATVRQDRAVLATAFGLGARLWHSRSWFVDLDFVGYGLYRYDSVQKNFDFAGIVQWRVPVGLQLTRGFAVFLAPALNVSIASSADNVLADPALYDSRRLTSSGSQVTVRLWPGFSAGLRFF
jgi:uncharacterized protein YjbI with pentapeptide repeats